MSNLVKHYRVCKWYILQSVKYLEYVDVVREMFTYRRTLEYAEWAESQICSCWTEWGKYFSKNI